MRAYLEDGNQLFFLCDRKACGEVCPNTYCSHTSDIHHAKNFDSVTVNPDNMVDYFEVDDKPDGLLLGHRKEAVD